MKRVLPESKFHLIPLGEIEGFKVRPGIYEINGATAIPGGVNFTIHSHQATACELLLFHRKEEEPYAVLPFPDNYRVGNVFSMIVFGLQIEDFEYAYRVDGPYCPEKGLRFDKKNILLDPYAKAVTGQSVWGEKAKEEENTYHARVVRDDFDWEDAHPLLTPLEDTVIYEMHVRGFTKDASSGVKFPGTFAGISEKIPYLKELGVTAVELMPIFEFDELKDAREYQGNRLLNYWGYNTVSFFAPNTSYAAGTEYNQEGNELKELIKELHENGLEVYLDVVFNHTAEGNEEGPVISFKGLDNQIYYILTPDGYYYNFSGCGNTLNCNHPIVQQMIMECLRHWVINYRIDGFRFDLASILGRNEDGTPMSKPPLLQSLAFDPILGNVKLIAEAWDAGGLYQVGNFPSWNRWLEWNGKYRDDMRSFLKGDCGKAEAAVTRIFGSADLYEERHGCNASVNFITCHDGFTLYDLYAYNEKHNEANGWNNSDGANDNASWNCGIEGETQDLEVMRLRIRMMKNAAAVLLFSRGVPMFLAGDEFGNTQFGNNNPYCQDNIISWLDWNLLEKNRSVFEFFKFMIAFRKKHDSIRKHTATSSFGFPEMSVHDVNAWECNLREDSHYIGIMYAGRTNHGTDDCVYLAINTYWENLRITLPKLPLEKEWLLEADTFEEQSVLPKPVSVGESAEVRARSVMVFRVGSKYE